MDRLWCCGDIRPHDHCSRCIDHRRENDADSSAWRSQSILRLICDYSLRPSSCLWFSLLCKAKLVFLIHSWDICPALLSRSRDSPLCQWWDNQRIHWHDTSGTWSGKHLPNLFLNTKWNRDVFTHPKNDAAFRSGRELSNWLILKTRLCLRKVRSMLCAQFCAWSLKVCNQTTVSLDHQYQCGTLQTTNVKWTRACHIHLGRKWLSVRLSCTHVPTEGADDWSLDLSVAARKICGQFFVLASDQHESTEHFGKHPQRHSRKVLSCSHWWQKLFSFQNAYLKQRNL